jgi:hypothetical protein
MPSSGFGPSIDNQILLRRIGQQNACKMSEMYYSIGLLAVSKQYFSFTQVSINHRSQLTSQPVVFFSNNKSAPVTNNQPAESSNMAEVRVILQLFLYMQSAQNAKNDSKLTIRV